MGLNKIEIKKVIHGEYTYPNWSTKKRYALKCKPINKNNLLVYYMTKSNKKISRIFPTHIKIDAKTCLILGLIKGEGANSLGNSNYRRFTFTNSDWNLVERVIDMLDKNKLYLKKNTKDKSLHILHFKRKEQEVINFWSQKLDLPYSKFVCFNEGTKTTDNGVCHLYISDVLLRRIIDLLINQLLYQGV